MNKCEYDLLTIPGGNIDLDDENLTMCSNEEYQDYLKTLTGKRLKKNPDMRLCDVHKIHN